MGVIFEPNVEYDILQSCFVDYSDIQKSYGEDQQAKTKAQWRFWKEQTGQTHRDRLCLVVSKLPVRQ